jgi:hypothetical protein
MIVAGETDYLPTVVARDVADPTRQIDLDADT